MNEGHDYNLWALYKDGWRVVFVGKLWQCAYQAQRWPKCLVDISKKQEARSKKRVRNERVD